MQAFCYIGLATKRVLPISSRKIVFTRFCKPFLETAYWMDKAERGDFTIQSQTDKREPDAGESGRAEEMNSTIP